MVFILLLPVWALYALACDKRILIMSRGWKNHGFPANRALKTDMRPSAASEFKNRNKDHFTSF